jgi:hypothetical protein
MQQIGYSLVDANGVEVTAYGNSTSDFMRLSVPDPVLLPNGDAVHCAVVGDTYSVWRLVPRMIVDNPPSPWYSEVSRSVTFDGQNTVVTVVYSDAPTIVPQTVSPRQARIALLNANLLDQVNTALNTAGGVALITWEYASSFSRADPMVASIGSALNLTSAQIDDMFRQASLL